MRFVFLILIISFGFFDIAAVNAQIAEMKKNTPTRIRSDIIDIKRKSKLVDFIGNVVVEKDDSSMLADKMRVVYHEKSNEQNLAQNNSKIERIDAEKNVKIFSEEFVATGEKGSYFPKDDLFILEQNVAVNNGTSIAIGEKFVYNIKTKKGNFVGAKKIENKVLEKGQDGRAVVIIGDDLTKEIESKRKGGK